MFLKLTRMYGGRNFRHKERTEDSSEKRILINVNSIRDISEVNFTGNYPEGSNSYITLKEPHYSLSSDVNGDRHQEIRTIQLFVKEDIETIERMLEVIGVTKNEN